MQDNYIKMLKELKSNYETEISNKDYSTPTDNEMKTIIFRRVTIKSTVLPTIEFLIKELEK